MLIAISGWSSERYCFARSKTDSIESLSIMWYFILLNKKEVIEKIYP